MPARSRSAAEAPRVRLRPLLASDAVAQLIRFAVAGVGVTLFSAGIYLGCAVQLGIAPLVANTVSTALGIIVGYVIHSRWSFRAGPGNDRTMASKFLVAAGGAFALNSFWVWLSVHALGLPAWTPVTGMVFVTPLASFAINRYWVFAS